MVFRVYVEKKPGFDVEAQQLAGELRTILGLTGLKALRIVNRYDVEARQRAEDHSWHRIAEECASRQSL